ncbi:hypothetical protein I6I98_08820 [Sphingobacterium multivorum]|uniref:Uncharacterized protein n=1 Tax=Sphingobacterium multivorum TaxID=28454 RepID=A0ABX7CVP0_SPHMU|nr:hypothetical protein [Sphingobacterium multivorum]QQT55340.1 hypothetical protein I6I98_08820 [Sphingobacterium multivorum]
MTGIQTNALKLFLSNHTQINHLTKITAAAIDYLTNSELEDDKLSQKINNLILESKQRWTPRYIQNPKKELNITKNELVKSLIVVVYSAFEVFYTETVGYVSDNLKKAKVNSTIGTEVENLPKLSELYKTLHWGTVEIDKINEVYSFFKCLRNCVAHNFGNPTKRLLDIYDSEQFKNQINNWETKFKDRSLSKPPIITSTEILLEPHHSILYSETCLRIAKDMTNNVYETLGIGYFINQISKKYILEIENIDTPCSSLAKYINLNLKRKYNIKINDIKIIKTELEKLKNYNSIKNKYNYLKENNGG